jgi:hypothetical protein
MCKLALLVLWSGFLASVVAGCGMRPEVMAPKELTVLHRFPGTVAVAVDQGATCGSAWIRGELALRTDLVREATESTIKRFSIFSDVKPPAQADYILQISYTDVSEPAFGLNFEASLEATWKLRRGQTVLWERPIKGEGRATLGDAFAGAQRARICEERTAAAHIKAGLEALSSSALPPG